MCVCMGSGFMVSDTTELGQGVRAKDQKQLLCDFEDKLFFFSFLNYKTGEEP